MNAVPVVVALELEELPLQVSGRPEERPVQALPPNRANEPFNKGMRERRVRHGLDFLHVEDAQVRLPSVELEQPIMIGTQLRRWRVASYRAVEHATQSHPIHRTALHAKADDPTGAVVHHDEHPMCAEMR